jgi:hypothetical protein
MPCGKKLKIPKGVMKVAKFGTPHGTNLISEAQKIDQMKLGSRLNQPTAHFPRKRF